MIGIFRHPFPGDGDAFLDVAFADRRLETPKVFLDFLLLCLIVKTQQAVHRALEYFRDGGQQFHVRITGAQLPAGDGLAGDSQHLSQRFLGDVPCFAKGFDVFADA